MLQADRVAILRKTHQMARGFAMPVSCGGFQVCQQMKHIRFFPWGNKT